jgi:hypothetical protein
MTQFVATIGKTSEILEKHLMFLARQKMLATEHALASEDGLPFLG